MRLWTSDWLDHDCTYITPCELWHKPRSIYDLANPQTSPLPVRDNPTHFFMLVASGLIQFAEAHIVIESEAGLACIRHVFPDPSGDVLLYSVIICNGCA